MCDYSRVPVAVSYFRDRLVIAAQSDFYKERAAAGRQLAAFAGEPVTDDVLAELLRDVEDSSVTSETAMALLARRDASEMRVVAEAFGSGDASIVSEVVSALVPS
jgi:hypothetical protein